MREALALTVAFLIGSFPSAFVWVRLRTGRDIRTMGSGNVGATNVFRCVSRTDGLIVLAADALKGAAGVYVGSIIWPSAVVTDPKLIQFAAGCAAILGHVFSPWLGFKGGKGVATGAGVALAVYPVPFLAALAGWWLLIKVTGYMSVASICSAYIFALATAFWIPSKTHALIAAAAAILITWTHRGNIARLRRGEEPRFSFKK